MTMKNEMYLLTSLFLLQMDIPSLVYLNFQHDEPQQLAPTDIPQANVVLEPGHSPLYWARLKSSGQDLRGVLQLARYTLDDLEQHKSMYNTWTVIQGKIYNITPYIPFHLSWKHQEATKEWLEEMAPSSLVSTILIPCACIIFILFLSFISAGSCMGEC
ncbi:unnamed protein product [Absidia cylindrospora]